MVCSRRVLFSHTLDRVHDTLLCAFISVIKEHLIHLVVSGDQNALLSYYTAAQIRQTAGSPYDYNYIVETITDLLTGRVSRLFMYDNKRAKYYVHYSPKEYARVKEGYASEFLDKIDSLWNRQLHEGIPSIDEIACEDPSYDVGVLYGDSPAHSSVLPRWHRLPCDFHVLVASGMILERLPISSLNDRNIHASTVYGEQVYSFSPIFDNDEEEHNQVNITETKTPHAPNSPSMPLQNYLSALFDYNIAFSEAYSLATVCKNLWKKGHDNESPYHRPPSSSPHNSEKPLTETVSSLVQWSSLSADESNRQPLHVPFSELFRIRPYAISASSSKGNSGKSFAIILAKSPSPTSSQTLSAESIPRRRTRAWEELSFRSDFEKWMDRLMRKRVPWKRTNFSMTNTSSSSSLCSAICSAPADSISSVSTMISTQNSSRTPKKRTPPAKGPRLSIRRPPKKKTRKRSTSMVKKKEKDSKNTTSGTSHPLSLESSFQTTTTTTPTTAKAATFGTSDSAQLQNLMKSHEEWETFCHARTVLEHTSSRRAEEKTNHTIQGVMEYESRMDEWLYPSPSSSDFSDARASILR